MRKPLMRKFLNQVHDTILPVDVFGEVGVICNTPQPHTVVTQELSQILRLKRTALISILQANSADSRIVIDNLLQVKRCTQHPSQKFDKGY